MSERIYHEQQSKALCAVHALNNLFQAQYTFTKKDLDDICLNLTPDSKWWNPHRSVLGIGDFDANVLLAALQTKGYHAIWFDKRKSLADMSTARVTGFILNIPSTVKVGVIPLPIKRKHWIAIRSLGGIFYNLDSKLNTPEAIGAETELKSFLKAQLDSGQSELFIIIENTVEKKDVFIQCQT